MRVMQTRSLSSSTYSPPALMPRIYAVSWQQFFFLLPSSLRRFREGHRRIGGEQERFSAAAKRQRGFAGGRNDNEKVRCKRELNGCLALSVTNEFPASGEQKSRARARGGNRMPLPRQIIMASFSRGEKDVGG